MKKRILLCAMLLNVACSYAATYRAAVINLKSGDSVCYALEGVSITAQGGNVEVTAPKGLAKWKLSEVVSFEVKEINADVTSVAEVKNFYVRFDEVNKILEINNYTGDVDFFLPGGQFYKSFDVRQNATIELGGLPQSLYLCVFRANGQTLKIITK